LRGGQWCAAECASREIQRERKKSRLNVQGASLASPLIEETALTFDPIQQLDGAPHFACFVREITKRKEAVCATSGRIQSSNLPEYETAWRKPLTGPPSRMHLQGHDTRSYSLQSEASLRDQFIPVDSSAPLTRQA